MKINVYDIDWFDKKSGYPTTETVDFIDCDNSMDDITEIISKWLAKRYGEHDGFVWEFDD